MVKGLPPPLKYWLPAKGPGYLHHRADVVVVCEDVADLGLAGGRALLAEIGQEVAALGDSAESAGHSGNAEDRRLRRVAHCISFRRAHG